MLGNWYPEWGTEDEGQVAGEHTVDVVIASQPSLQRTACCSSLRRPLADRPSLSVPQDLPLAQGHILPHKVHVQ